MVNNISRRLEYEDQNVSINLNFVFAVLIIAGSCATRRKAISDEDFMEAWSGTWINTDYGKSNPQKKFITMMEDGKNMDW